jgi:hypothetical protein
MVHATLTLTLSDRQTVTASITAETPDREQVVSYSGAVDRLPRKYDTADLPVLRAWASNLAKEINATVTEDVTGTYDYWAK